MKKFLLSLSALLVLAACGGETTVSCANRYWDGTVGTCLPTGWHVVDRAVLTEKGIPADVLVAFQSDAPASGYFPTVSVVRESLTRQMAPSEYSDASVQSVQGMQGYTKVDMQKVQMDGNDVILHIFTAQPTTDEPRTRFYQISSTAGLNGYTYTAAAPVTIASTLEQQILLIMQNATLVAPQK